jgi:hypothetical protein
MPRRHVDPTPARSEVELRGFLDSTDYFHALALTVYTDGPYNARGWEVDWITDRLVQELPKALLALAREAEVARQLCRGNTPDAP